jgi:hypothetical protein
MLLWLLTIEVVVISDRMLAIALGELLISIAAAEEMKYQ